LPCCVFPASSRNAILPAEMHFLRFFACSAFFSRWQALPLAGAGVFWRRDAPAFLLMARRAALSPVLL
jgi:hypothetical protein